MFLERDGEYRVVFRVVRDRRQYFSFYVDDDKSSWTYMKASAHRFGSARDTAEAIGELRKRSNEQRRRSRIRGLRAGHV